MMMGNALSYLIAIRMMKLIMNTSIAKYIMNLPCFWYSGVSFLKNTKAAPYNKPIIGEISAII